MSSFGCKAGLFPVTALHFSKEKLLLAGCGPYLRIFSTVSQTMLTQVEVLPSKRIHGITLKTIGDNLFVLVFGQKHLRWITFSWPRAKFVGMSSIYDQLDRIYDTCCLSFENIQTFKVAIALAHNSVAIFDSKTSAQILITSEINCLLYCSHIRHSLSHNELYIASGTVFNQILLWSIDLSDICFSKPPLSLCNEVSLTLKGHEGVVFDVSFDKTLNRLASVSDDRSVRIWTLPSEWHKMKHVTLTSSQILYGHTARIWKVIWSLSMYIFSIGEDAACRVWDIESGSCKDVITGHQGRNIWSIAYDEESMSIFTGGEDCSIRICKLSVDSPQQKYYNSVMQLSLDVTDSPRALVLWNNYLFCLTNKGSLYQADISFEKEWRLFHFDSRYAGYGVLSLAKKLPVVSVGSLEGTIKLLSLSSPQITFEWDCHKGKVFSIVWIEGLISPDNASNCIKEPLLTCGPNGNMVCWIVSYESAAVNSITVEPLVYLFLPPSKHQWITCGILLHSGANQSLIVCGDRKGTVHVYQLDGSKKTDQLLPPIQSFSGIHGPNGVTHLANWNNSVYSVGRDGCCRQYVIRNSILVVVNKFHPIAGVSWIDNITYTLDLGLLTIGFHGSEFILHSSNINGPVFTFNCGGGHRSYAITSYSAITKTGMLSLAYIKGSAVYIVHENVSNRLFKPVIQETFVGREAVCMKMLTTSIDNMLVAVGSEDCSIVLLSIGSSQDSTYSLKVCSSLTEHISAVQSLTSVKSISDQSILLFSGGGRASLKSWTINLLETTLGASLQCEYNLHNLPARPQRRKKITNSIPPECRITSLTSFPLTDVLINEGSVYVAAGCSDGIIRMYLYEEEKRFFSLFDSIDYHRHCVLVVDHVILSPGGRDLQSRTAILMSAATDGLVVFWDLMLLLNSLTKEKTSAEQPEPDLKMLKKPEPVIMLSINVHQSGVNDISTCILDSDSFPNSLLLASVGDDNCLTVTLCLLSHDHHMTLAKQIKLVDAHHSAITSVRFASSNHLLTTSIDQRLVLWHVKISKEDIIVMKKNEIIHNVVDPACMLVHQMKGQYRVLISGIGMECIDLNITNVL